MKLIHTLILASSLVLAACTPKPTISDSYGTGAVSHDHIVDDSSYYEHLNTTDNKPAKGAVPAPTALTKPPFTRRWEADNNFLKGDWQKPQRPNPYESKKT